MTNQRGYLDTSVSYPAKILTRYKLNDQIKIQDRVFRINSIKTNLNTGATELELLNLITGLDTII